MANALTLTGYRSLQPSLDSRVLRRPTVATPGLPVAPTQVTPTATTVTSPLAPRPLAVATQLPAVPTALPPSGVIGTQLPALDGAGFVATTQPGGPAIAPNDVVAGVNQQFGMATLPSAADTTMTALDQILNREGSYITNARRRGLELANQRGLLNSNMAAGASERAAVEAAQPILSQIMGLTGQREGQNFDATMQSRAAAQDVINRREQNAFVGQQAALDRTQGVNDALLGSQLAERQATVEANLRGQLQGDATRQQDWLSDRQFNREFNSALSMMSIGSVYDLNRAIFDYAAENPEVYTPEIISGMTNFFQANLTGLLQQYFPDLSGGGP